MSFCASVVCKDNYAAIVQQIMPAAVTPGRLADRGDLHCTTIHIASGRNKSAPEIVNWIDSGF